MTDTEIHIADKVAVTSEQYPEYFDACRDMWLKFIRDPSDEEDEYLDLVTAQVTMLNGTSVPEADRARVVVDSFWAASADAILNKRAQQAQQTADAIREGLEEVWDSGV